MYIVKRCLFLERVVLFYENIYIYIYENSLVILAVRFPQKEHGGNKRRK